MEQDRFTLTKSGYETLKQELAELKGRHEEEQAEFADTNYSSDPSKEEAAYFDAKVTKEETEERIRYLEFVLSHADVVDEDPDPTRIDPGDEVHVWDFKDKRALKFYLIGSAEAMNGLRGVSIDSPVGKALLGRRVGDVVEVEVPEGKVRYAIRKIERPAAVK